MTWLRIRVYCGTSPFDRSAIVSVWILPSHHLQACGDFRLMLEVVQEKFSMRLHKVDSPKEREKCPSQMAPTTSTHSSFLTLTVLRVPVHSPVELSSSPELNGLSGSQGLFIRELSFSSGWKTSRGISVDWERSQVVASSPRQLSSDPGECSTQYSTEIATHRIGPITQTY